MIPNVTDPSLLYVTNSNKLDASFATYVDGMLEAEWDIYVDFSKFVKKKIPMQEDSLR